VLVLTGKGQLELERLKHEGRAPQHVAGNVQEAAAIVLASRLSPPRS
jgi:hypothetical protein